MAFSKIGSFWKSPQLSAEQDALYEVNEALKQILNGGYGICEETGEAIPAARLRAVPWTRFTREIEERLEKKGIVHGARLNKADTVRSKGQIWLAPEEEAEKMEEKPSAPPNDEALSRVFSPPGSASHDTRIPNAHPRQDNGKDEANEADFLRGLGDVRRQGTAGGF